VALRWIGLWRGRKRFDQVTRAALVSSWSREARAMVR